MANRGLQPMCLALRWNIRTEAVGRLSLTHTRNIIVLALDREQGDATDFGGINTHPTVSHFALRQRVTHEHGLDSLQVKFGRKVHDCKVFVVEFAMLLRGVAVAVHEVQEQFAVRLDVPVEIHAHETVELQKSRIDVSHETGIWKRHLGDDVAPKPVRAASFCQRIDDGGVDAGVNGTTHQHHGMRHIGIAGCFHAGDRGEHRDGRLTDRKHVHVAAE